MLRHTTGMPALDAREDFARARRGQRLRRLLGSREGTEPRVLLGRRRPTRVMQCASTARPSSMCPLMQY